MEFIHLLPNGYSYPTTSTLSFIKAGYNVGFVPIAARKAAGKSQIKIVRDGVKFVTIILRIITLFSPMKVFLPLALAVLPARPDLRRGQLRPRPDPPHPQRRAVPADDGRVHLPLCPHFRANRGDALREYAAMAPRVTPLPPAPVTPPAWRQRLHPRRLRLSAANGPARRAAARGRAGRVRRAARAAGVARGDQAGGCGAGAGRGRAGAGAPLPRPLFPLRAGQVGALAGAGRSDGPAAAPGGGLAAVLRRPGHGRADAGAGGRPDQSLGAGPQGLSAGHGHLEQRARPAVRCGRPGAVGRAGGLDFWPGFCRRYRAAGGRAGRR